MGKKFKGKLCAYCGKSVASTEDHVFAREFFLVRDRNNLPKAPACNKCNGEKSGLEHYLTAVLPFAGRHDQALENLREGVPRRLAKNKKVQDTIESSIRRTWVQEESGLYEQSRMFSFDSEKLRSLIAYVARGLIWYHWNAHLRDDDGVSVLFLHDMGSALFGSILHDMQPAQRVDVNLGSGTIDYVGLQAPDPPQLTIWMIRIYGGMVMTDDGNSERAHQTCTMIWAITGPPELQQTIARAFSGSS